MIALTRRERWLVGLWLTVAVVVWNGLYDLLLARDTGTYLFQAAMHRAGNGPAVDLTTSLDRAVRYAASIATVWAVALLLLGLVTMRAASSERSSNA
jgi:UPF0716 family protein affecting phage T7 exclusion